MALNFEGRSGQGWRRALCVWSVAVSLVACEKEEPPGLAPSEETRSEASLKQPPAQPAPAKPEADAGDPPKADPAVPLWGDKGAEPPQGTWATPERYRRVVPRLSYPIGDLFRDVCYEGNNLVMRGPKDKGDLYRTTGEEVAARWGIATQKLSCVFVLRDSLFSQQDHPWRQRAHALMMPPSWLTVAADAASKKQRLRPMKTYLPDNDAAWAKIKDAQEMFGSFPPSEKLFALATQDRRKTRADQQSAILNARHSLRMLAEDVIAMMRHENLGAQGLVAAGVLRIRDSDRRYFGDKARREVVVPILVENPTPKEVIEGKGLLPEGRTDISPEVVAMVRKELYGRRLEDGDLAVERYDISQESERKRAVELLETLIPRGSQGHTVWLWVTGPIKPGTKLKGEDAVEWIGLLRQELEAANVEPGRLRLLSKPSVPLPRGQGRAEAFEDALTRYDALDLPLSVNLNSRALRALITKAEARRDP